MLNVSSSTAVSWPTPVSNAVAPVSPVTAVQPVQAGGNDGKAQMGFGREGRAAQPQAVAARGAAKENHGTPTTEGTAPAAGDAGGVPAPHDLVAQRKLRQEVAQTAEQQKAKDKKAVEHLQNVLSRMWEASAAVVDRALGIEPSNASELPGNQSDTAPDLSAVAASMIPRKPLVPDRPARPALEPLPWPVMPEAAEGGEAVALPAEPLPTTDQVVAYDEHGNSSLAPLEAGSLISERV